VGRARLILKRITLRAPLSSAEIISTNHKKTPSCLSKDGVRASTSPVMTELVRATFTAGLLGRDPLQRSRCEQRAPLRGPPGDPRRGWPWRALLRARPPRGGLFACARYGKPCPCPQVSTAPIRRFPSS